MTFLDKKPLILIVDYGLGNIYSVERALRFVGASVEITDNPDRILKAEKLILPGVGAFGKGMEGLRKKSLIEPVKEYVKRGRPLLGICLGMHLLFTEGKEFGIHKGLDIISGRVGCLRSSQLSTDFYKIPHIGWNRLIFPRKGEQEKKISMWHNTILENLREGDFMYFIHSNIAILNDSSNCLAETVYGDNVFSSVIRKRNIYGCQFHPERSGKAGLEIYRKFVFEMKGEEYV